MSTTEPIMNANTTMKNKKNTGIGLTYLGLALLRILLVIVPQRGYIHPDEYFQSLEIVVGDVFETDRSAVWEFDDQNPVRNIAIPYILYGLPVAIFKYVVTVTNFQGTVSPYYLVIFPRLFICLLSFSVDYSLISICQKCGTNIKRRLIVLASSYVMLVFGSRTFSNTLEMILFALLLRVVVNNVIEAEEDFARETKLRKSLNSEIDFKQKVSVLLQLNRLPHRDYTGAVEIGFIVATGMFNRPTFIAYAIGPVFFWLHRGPGLRKMSLSKLHFRCAYLISIIGPLCAGLIFFDTIYYKNQNVFVFLYNNGLKECLRRIDNCLVITPLNFIKYNMDPMNLAEHGIHPKYLHLFNIILLYNVLGISCIVTMISVFLGLFRRPYPNESKLQTVSVLAIICAAIPFLILSMFQHQEPRFLIPLTLPIVLLSGLSMNTVTITNGKAVVRWKKTLFSAWLVINTIFVIFYGFLHQGGILPALEHITSVENEMLSHPTRFHILSSHIYSIPKSFLTNYVGEKRRLHQVIVYPASSSSLEAQMNQLSTVGSFVNRHPPHDDVVYFLYPSSLTENFLDGESLKDLNLVYSLERCFRIHLSVESLPRIHLSLETLPLMSWSFVSSLVRKNTVGLNVIVLRSAKYLRKQGSVGKYFSGGSKRTPAEFYRNVSCSF